MDLQKLREIIATHIEFTSSNVNDSTLWWELAEDGSSELDNLLNNIMEAIDKYGQSQYAEGYNDGMAVMHQKLTN